jgi:hypothetical protein
VSSLTADLLLLAEEKAIREAASRRGLAFRPAHGKPERRGLSVSCTRAAGGGLMSNEIDALLSGVHEYQHPKLRYWLAERERNPTNHYRVEIHRPKRGLTYGTARLYVHVLGPDGTEVQPPDEMLWDDDLDESFIQHGFRAISNENEAVRFSLALRRSLRKPERRYGEGFFNAVLVRWVRESAFSGKLTDILDKIHEGDVAEGAAYSDCKEQIHAAFVNRAQDLTGRLQYNSEDATWILAHAMAAYLDERFSVSSRIALGFT